MGKFLQLFIPRKGSNNVDDLDVNWRAIEQWAKQVTSSGGAYASLTGPGQGSSPGGLTQDGPFDIFDNTSGPGIQFFTINNVTITSEDGMLLEETGTAGMELRTPHELNLNGGYTNVGSGAFAAELGFFQDTPAIQQTVTGSRGGNVALAGLLTSLARYGLIIDSTTP